MLIERSTMLMIYPHGWASQRDHEWRPITEGAAQAGFVALVAEWDVLTVEGNAVLAERAIVRFGPSQEPLSVQDIRFVPDVVFTNWGVDWDYRSLFQNIVDLSGAWHGEVPCIAWLDGKCEFEGCLRAYEARSGRSICRPATLLSAEIRAEHALPADELVIVKPSRSGQCRGIEIVPRSVLPRLALEGDDGGRDAFVVQRLIGDVFLFEGRRWDVRVYAVATSLAPMRFRVYHEGVAKTAAVATTPGGANLDEWLNADSHQDGKRPAVNLSMTQMLGYLERSGTPLTGFWTRVEEVTGDVFAALALFADEHACALHQQFLFLGLDFIVERSERRGFDVQLLEINTNPGMGWEPDIGRALVGHHREWFEHLGAVARAGEARRQAESELA